MLKKHKTQLAKIYRAVLCTRMATLVVVLCEAAKVISALTVFFIVWQRFSNKPTAISQQKLLEQFFQNPAPQSPGELIDIRDPTSFIPFDAAVNSNYLAEGQKPSASKNRPRIFCLCSTTGPKHKERALHVRATWGRRCDRLLFASDVKDNYLPAEAFHNETGRQFVSYKLFNAWKYVHDKHAGDFEWFVKADDDTFVVMENLRDFLDAYNHSDAHYFGRPLSINSSKYHLHYVSGSAYVFSRTTLRRLVKEAYPNKSLCPGPKRKANEDAYIGYCLYNIGIKSGETRDELMRNRFLVFSSWTHLHVGSAGKNNWIWSYDKNYVEGDRCCSSKAISLHYMSGGKLLSAEYLIYRLRPFGVGNSVVVRAIGPV